MKVDYRDFNIEGELHLRCESCGAVVPYYNRNMHDRWHEYIQLIFDQSIGRNNAK